jgi:four helix bundle protein
MDKKELEKRTKKFALEVIKFVADLPKNKITNVLGYQLLKCGTSIGANYREANRAQSHQDFIHKIAIVEKEASETQYWLAGYFMNGLLRPRIWASFRASSGFPPCDVLFKYASDAKPCACPVACPSSRSRDVNS